jgi:hypothetical protein
MWRCCCWQQRHLGLGTGESCNLRTQGGRGSELTSRGRGRLGEVTAEHAAQRLIHHRLMHKQAPWQQDHEHAEGSLRPAVVAVGGGGCSEGEACCQQSGSTDLQQTGCSRAGAITDVCSLLRLSTLVADTSLRSMESEREIPRIRASAVCVSVGWGNVVQSLTRAIGGGRRRRSHHHGGRRMGRPAHAGCAGARVRGERRSTREPKATRRRRGTTLLGPRPASRRRCQNRIEQGAGSRYPY